MLDGPQSIDQIITSRLDWQVPRTYKSGNILLFQGEVPRSVLYVREGYVIAYTINASGDDQIIAFYSVGDLLPCEWIFKKSPVSLYYYKAFTDCELVALKRDELITLIHEESTLAEMLLEQYVASFIGSSVHIHALEHSHSQEKLIKLFHFLVLRFGTLMNSETYTIDLRLTQSQLASMIGVTRETVATEIQKLKRRHALIYQGGHYTVDLSILIRSLGGEDFAELTI